MWLINGGIVELTVRWFCIQTFDLLLSFLFLTKYLTYLIKKVVCLTKTLLAQETEKIKKNVTKISWVESWSKSFSLRRFSALPKVV